MVNVAAPYGPAVLQALPSNPEGPVAQAGAALWRLIILLMEYIRSRLSSASVAQQPAPKLCLLRSSKLCRSFDLPGKVSNCAEGTGSVQDRAIQARKRRTQPRETR